MAEKKAPGSRKPKEVAAKAPARRPAKTAAAVVKPTRTRKPPPADPTPEERWRMVAEAAYYIAEKRGFVGGDPAADWYEAENQVALSLEEARKARRKKAST